MAYDKVIDSAALDAGMTATANAIRAKTGGSSPIAWDSADGFKAAVEGIDTEGGVELPELNNPVVEAEVFIGKEYINGDGQKKIGSFTIDDELTEQDSLISQITNALRNKAANNGSVALPELGDTAAQPTDIVAGKVLYDDEGNPVTGELYEILEGKVIAATEFQKLMESSGGTISTLAAMNVADAVVRKNSIFRTVAPASAFGDATPDQVVKGATFTSAAGLLVEGALEEVEAGKAMSAREDAVARLNNDGTVQILAKTNFTFPGVIVRNGAYLRTTAPISAFDGIFGGVDVSVDGETLVITGDVTVENDTLIL